MIEVLYGIGAFGNLFKFYLKFEFERNSSVNPWLKAILGFLANKLYFRGGICKSKNRLDGKITIITGSNTGIGYETALDFAYRGARVILACRDTKKAEIAAKEIIKETKNTNVEVEYIDLSDLDTVRSFAEKMNKNLTRLDILVNNAGIMMCPNWRTKQGFEMQFGTNHLGHFLLTNLLLDLLKKTSLPYFTTRIVNVSSRAHYDFGMNWNDINWEKSYSPIKAYAQSKLANILFTKELSNRLKDTGVIAVSLHPGVVRTELVKYIGESILSIFPIVFKIFGPIYWIFTKSAKEGAQTTIHCSVDDTISQYSGCYFSDCKLKKPSEEARNREFATKLWNISEKLVKI